MEVAQAMLLELNESVVAWQIGKLFAVKLEITKIEELEVFGGGAVEEKNDGHDLAGLKKGNSGGLALGQ
jgi:hypothetical protein